MAAIEQEDELPELELELGVFEVGIMLFSPYFFVVQTYRYSGYRHHLLKHPDRYRYLMLNLARYWYQVPASGPVDIRLLYGI